VWLLPHASTLRDPGILPNSCHIAMYINPEAVYRDNVANRLFHVIDLVYQYVSCKGMGGVLMSWNILFHVTNGAFSVGEIFNLFDL